MMKVSERQTFAPATRFVLAAAVESGTHENCLSGLLFGDQRRHVSGCARLGRSSRRSCCWKRFAASTSEPSLDIRVVDRNGISATKVDVLVDGRKELPLQKSPWSSMKISTDTNTSMFIRRNTCMSTSMIMNTHTGTRTLIILIVG